MSYPYYQSTLDGWGSNQWSSVGGGYDYFRAHAPHMDPAIFNQVYGKIFSADTAPVGVGINEARIWHRRGYGGICAINALTPQEIGYASAYEAYRFWIHNIALYELFGAEIERQRESFTGLAIAEAIKMYMISSPADVDGCIPACEAAAVTALHIFDENLSSFAGGDMSAGTGYDTGMDVGTYGSGFGTPGMAGSGMASVIDPHAIDYEAPYFRQRTGRHRRLSMPAPYGATGVYTNSPRAGSVIGGIGGSPYLGTSPGMGMGANPAIYGGGSPPVGGNGMGLSRMHGSVYPAYGAGSSVYGGASPVHAPPIYRAPSPYNNTPNVTTVSAYPGTTTVIQLPRRHHRSSSRHHKHHSRRARSAEPDMITYTNTMGSPNVRGAAVGAARAVGGAVGGIAGGAAGFVGGAVGGLARGAVGGFTRGSSIGASGPMRGGVGGSYGSPNKGYGYPGHKSIYRY
ncbi:uncharacterized protein BJ212DRAFT_1588950 [Suillus subaureus]|uniref:Uncharacterized protein n=1 Tax=Suillus subaureus TaxID=48587 RepID=A0A9P7E6Q7_9AGAM|nr:uncharacterized protein BJ212DRAFT_1588950 [Suillus subaureus]KAG1812417.1 hypothetical protein BJ212DRAFT_1588950 [Suillus subaureus]